MIRPIVLHRGRLLSKNSLDNREETAYVRSFTYDRAQVCRAAAGARAGFARAGARESGPEAVKGGNPGGLLVTGGEGTGA